MNNIDNWESDACEIDLSKCRILVIDDNEDTRNLFATGGRTRGYQVTLCKNGEEGVFETKNAEKHYDVVFLDLILPDGNGLDILLEIRRERPEFNVIIITGCGKVDTAVTAMKEGADDYIEKPFDIDAIVFHIKRSVQFRRLKDRLRKSTIHITILSKVADLMDKAASLQKIFEYSVKALTNIPLTVGASLYRKESGILELKAADGIANDIEKEIKRFTDTIKHCSDDGIRQFSECEFKDRSLGWTCKPLRYQDRILGVVNIFHQLESPIDSQEWSIIQTFINQVSYAIASSDETRQITNGIIACMGKKTEVKEALGALLHGCVERFKGDRGCILIFDDHKVMGEGGNKRAEVSLVSFWDHNWRLKQEGTTEKFASLCSVTVREIDYSYFPVLKKGNIYERFYNEAPKSVMVAGIFVDDCLLGSITIASDKEDAFSEDQVRLLRIVSNRVSPHILLSRQHTIDRMTNELNRFLNKLDIRSRDFLAGFTDKVVDVLKCEACNLYLLHEFKFYILKASTSPKDESQIPFSFDLDDGPDTTGFLQYVVEKKLSLRLNHPREFRRFLKKHKAIHVDPDDENFPYLQFLGIPIELEDKCIGVIELAQHSLYKTFTINDQKVLENVTFNLSRAIMSQKLYQIAKECISDRSDLGGWIK
ncbi:response regulator [Desulfobacterales bacterium HSG2]|nr:response regulator [Desulfobacterales bacterium HSG2]